MTGWCSSEALSTATFSTLWRKSSFTCTRASPGRKEVGGARFGPPRRDQHPAAAGGLFGAGRPVAASPARRGLPSRLGAGAADGSVPVSAMNRSGHQCDGRLGALPGSGLLLSAT